MIQNTADGVSNQLYGAVVMRCLGTPSQTKVSGDRQRETTHEISCLAADCSKYSGIHMVLLKSSSSEFYEQNQKS